MPLREGAERWATLYLVFADRDATGHGALRMSELIRAGIAEHCPKGGGALSDPILQQ